MGKTVTCQRLAILLDERRRADPGRAISLCLDLRNVTGLDRGVPRLLAILEECMGRGWAGAEDCGFAAF